MLTRRTGAQEQEPSGQGIEQFVLNTDDGCAAERITPENFNKLFNRQGASSYALIVVVPGTTERFDVYFGQFSRHKKFEDELRRKVPFLYSILRGQVWKERNGIIDRLQLFDEDVAKFFSILDIKEIRALIKKLVSGISPELLKPKLQIDLNGSTCYYYFKDRSVLKPFHRATIGSTRKN